MTTQMKESVSAWPNSNPAFRPATSTDVERKIRVAFVEDDDDYREAVSSELGDHGFDVATFSDGAALLASFAEGAEAEIIVENARKETRGERGVLTREDVVRDLNVDYRRATGGLSVAFRSGLFGLYGFTTGFMAALRSARKLKAMIQSRK